MKTMSLFGFGTCFVGVALASLAGCSSSPQPTAQTATTSAEVRAAQELRAEELPQAQYHLKLALDQLEQAKRLIANDENEQASRLLVRAQADAEVAVALAREAKTKNAAQAAEAELQKLRAK